MGSNQPEITNLVGLQYFWQSNVFLGWPGLARPDPTRPDPKLTHGPMGCPAHQLYCIHWLLLIELKVGNTREHWRIHNGYDKTSASKSSRTQAGPDF